MKKPILFLLFSLIAKLSFAQVAPSAEEISPLLIGQQIPSTQITAINGEASSLTDLVKGQKSVLLFYRGGWCPYCNLHLAEVGEMEKEIKELGFNIIAISPDSPEKLQESVEKQSLDYQLYSDADGELIKAMGLAFKAPENYGSMLSKVSGDKNKGILPVSSLFITDGEGIILFQYVSPDYKQRISGKMLMAVLESLQEED